MAGSILAVCSAIFFAITGIFSRRAVTKVTDVTLGVQVSVPVGALFFLLILILMGQIRTLTAISWQSYFWLSAAGINHYVIGRSLHFKCVQLVGQNIANILNRIRTLAAVILGISLLGEPLSWQLVLGVLLIIFGVTVTGMNPRMFRHGHSLFANIPRKAYFYGFTTGICWGLSPIFIKLGFNGENIPVAGAFISFMAATVLMSLSLLTRQRRTALIGMTQKAVFLFSLQGLLSSTANLLRYMALSLAPASVVSPLASTYPVALLILSYFFNRKLEIFNVPVITGTLTVVAGSILLF